jgi:hypothetical protein
VLHIDDEFLASRTVRTCCKVRDVIGISLFISVVCVLHQGMVVQISNILNKMYCLRSFLIAIEYYLLLVGGMAMTEIPRETSARAAKRVSSHVTCRTAATPGV